MKKTQTLNSLVAEVGQVESARLLGCHQSTISQVIRKKRVISVTFYDDGTVEAVELSRFPQPSKTR
ncbi:hypothetical protein S483_001304 [Salmonella enterica subsp. salamae]|nr:hypothetical protein [Salmonella enterica subsp. enterica]EEJ7233412.1 hypothetical protein [Salmonella enterica subsp. salamae]